MAYKRHLRNNGQILRFYHIVSRLFCLIIQQVIFNDIAAEPSHSRHHHRRLTSISLKDHPESKLRRKWPSQQFDSRSNSSVQELQVPDTPRSLLSPTDPTTPAPISPLYPPSHVSYEVDEYPENDVDPSEIERRRAHRPLLLLTRSRGTQTEAWPSLLSPSPLPSQLSSMSPIDPSESSSFSDSPASHVSTILDRVLALLNRMSQADALTLTNRLKRQNLKGADVGHLSRSTVNHILSEATGLRSQFRSLLEDDKMVVACTRKDMRLLFKFVKDVFAELGQMRVILNDVILDPSSANRVSELALNPEKADAVATEREVSAQAGAVGWMAPISKLFSPAGRNGVKPVDRHATLVPSTSSQGTSRPPRSIPKLGPALAASATTVNVEFSGTGRSVSSTFSSQPLLAQADFHPNTVPGVMDIFAGAPRSHAESDPWIVVPPTDLRHSRSLRKMKDTSTTTAGRSPGCTSANEVSRNVDAIVGLGRSQAADEESDVVPPLLKRTLRRRGLSDSSIHSTFMSQADATSSPHSSTNNQHHHAASSRLAAWPDRNSVFQALSRTMQNIRATAGSMKGPLGGVEVGADTPIFSHSRRQKSGIFSFGDFAAKDDSAVSRPQTPTRDVVQPKPIRIASNGASGGGGGGRNVYLSGWTNSNLSFGSGGSDPFVVSSSLRDELRGRGRDERGPVRDFF